MRSVDQPAPQGALGAALASLTFTHVAVALGALTVLRIAGLYFSRVDLFMDEAQYWAWSQELAYGYFSKPPLLAWVIAATGQICGTGEACVRIGSPLLHFATSLVVYAIADMLYGRQAAAWSALVYGLGIAVVFSSRIISTDVPLVFFWALALLAWLKLLPRPDWRWSVVFGAALGLGILAKYAMIYFLLGAFAAAWFDRDARAWLTRRDTGLAFVIAALLVLPNVLWNIDNGFATFRHTGDNISGSGFRLQPLGALQFVGAQFAVFGPFVFAAFLYLLACAMRHRVSRDDALMLAFAIPPLALVIALSFFRSANANWAAPAAVSMIVVVVAWWQRHAWRHWFNATLVLGLVLQIVLIAGDANANRLSVPLFGKQVDPYRRTLGWHALGERTAALAEANRAGTVAADGRAELAALIYYLRARPQRVVSWPMRVTPDNHFELTRPLDNAAAEPVLFVTACPIVSRLQRFYEKVTPVGPFVVQAGPNTPRQYHAFLLQQRRRPIEPFGCAEAPP